MTDPESNDEDWTLTLPDDVRFRGDGTTTCPKTRGGSGGHHFVPNQQQTAFSCECRARAERSAPADQRTNQRAE